jgi:hypothetical protein
MKKCVLLILILFMTGCNTKELICTKIDKSSSDITIKEEIVIKYNKKVETFYFKSNVEAGSIYKKYMKELKNSMIDKYILNIELEGIEKKANINKQNIVIEISGNIKKMDMNTKNALDIFSVDNSIGDIKKELKNRNYVCHKKA